MATYQIFSSALGIMVSMLIFYLVRRDHLRAAQAVWWLAVACVVLILGIIPSVTDSLAQLVGVSYPPVLALLAALLALTIKVLLMDIERTRQEREIRRLVQRLAIWEADKINVTQEPQ
jgi:hypothetical protein